MIIASLARERDGMVKFDFGTNMYSTPEKESGIQLVGSSLVLLCLWCHVAAEYMGANPMLSRYKLHP